VIELKAENRTFDGLEAEIDAEIRTKQPWRQWQGVQVPLAALGLQKRDNAALAGNNMHPLTSTGHLDQLFTQIDGGISSDIVADRIGATVISGLTEASYNIPRQTSMMSASHVAIDSPLPTSSDPTFSNATLTPKLIGSISQINLSAALAQHPALGGTDFVGRELSRALTQEINRAVLYGNNSLNPAEPNGLAVHSTDTTETVSIDALAIDSMSKIKAGLLDYLKSTDHPARWLLQYRLLDRLRTVSAYTGSVESAFYVLGLDSGTAAGYPVVSTTLFEPTATTPGYLGDFSTIVHGFWEGVSIVINPYDADAYAQGAVKVRIMALHDVGCVDPKRIRKFTYDLS
jgi:HK97 family phage major capsid protein